MNVERLELMATLLDEVAAGTWDMGLLPKEVAETLKADGYYELSSREEKPVFYLEDWISGENPCGYTACAVGHAALDSRFNALGLTLDNGSPKFTSRDGRRVYRSWKAVREFFDINNHQAYYLFNDVHYATKAGTRPEQVAARIREFITTNGKIED